MLGKPSSAQKAAAVPSFARFQVPYNVPVGERGDRARVDEPRARGPGGVEDRDRAQHVDPCPFEVVVPTERVLQRREVHDVCHARKRGR